MDGIKVHIYIIMIYIYIYILNPNYISVYERKTTTIHSIVATVEVLKSDSILYKQCLNNI